MGAERNSIDLERLFKDLTRAGRAANLIVEDRKATQQAPATPSGLPTLIQDDKGAIFILGQAGYKHVTPEFADALGGIEGLAKRFGGIPRISQITSRTVTNWETSPASLSESMKLWLGVGIDPVETSPQDALLIATGGTTAQLSSSQTGGVIGASIQDLIRKADDDLLRKIETQMRVSGMRGTDIDLIQSELNRRGRERTIETAPTFFAEPSAPAAPTIQEIKPSPAPVGEIPAVMEPLKQAEIQTGRLTELAPPGIEEFKFQSSGAAERIGAEQFAAAKTGIEQQIQEARGVGLEELASRGRRGGSVAQFGSELAGRQAELLGKAQLESTETERKAIAAEREQKFNEFLAPKMNQLREFDSRLQARVSAITGYINSAKANAETSFDQFQNFLDASGAAFQQALALKALDVQRRASAGELSIAQSQQEIAADKVRLEGLQNELNAKLNPEVLKNLQGEARAQYVSGVVSSILGATGLGAAIGSVIPGVGTAVGAGIGLGVGTIIAFSDKIF